MLGLVIKIIVNVVSLILAIYLSLKPRPISTRIKVVVWAVVLVITLGNIYWFIVEQRTQKLIYVDALIPNISSLEAFDMTKSEFENELRGYDLVDVIGSSYVCLYKPDRIFHRFPEWTFVFRKGSTNMIEVKVSDSRIPEPPSLSSRMLDEIKDGQIAYYIISKKGFYNFSSNTYLRDSDINYSVDIIDQKGRTVITFNGRGHEDTIPEIEDGINARVLARAQVIGRTADHVAEYRVIEEINNKRTIILRKSSYKVTPFYVSLQTITNWKIDAEKAIDLATKLGATGSPPGKEQAGGHPTVRLCDGRIHNLKGSYWKIPYRIGIRPILVEASSGQVYAVNNKGDYSTRWESTFDVGSFNSHEGTSDSIPSAPSEETPHLRDVAPKYDDHQTPVDRGSKVITDLSSDELDTANAICRKSLEDYFASHIVAWYETTYNYLPVSDEDSDQGISNMTKLSAPIKVLSVTGMFGYDVERMKRELKVIVNTYSASFGGKRLRIVKTLVIIELGAGGGSIGALTDKVTVIPYVVSIE